jgi:hypothetical protein
LSFFFNGKGLQLFVHDVLNLSSCICCVGDTNVVMFSNIELEEYKREINKIAKRNRIDTLLRISTSKCFISNTDIFTVVNIILLTRFNTVNNNGPFTIYKIEKIVNYRGKHVFKIYLSMNLVKNLTLSYITRIHYGWFP